jgi:hypothetical protein
MKQSRKGSKRVKDFFSIHPRGRQLLPAAAIFGPLQLLSIFFCCVPSRERFFHSREWEE